MLPITIGKGIIDITIVDKTVIFGTLMGACTWNLITWYFGLPTSSSHALIGGMIGAAVVKAGTSALVWKGIIKTVVFIVISPTVGLLLGLGFGLLVYRLFKSSPDLWLTVFSERASWSQRHYIVLATAAMTRRRLWVLLRAFFSVPVFLGISFMFLFGL